MLYTTVQCNDNVNDAVFLLPCCIAAGCSPGKKNKQTKWYQCEINTKQLKKNRYLPLITCTLTLAGAAIVGTHE